MCVCYTKCLIWRKPSRENFLTRFRIRAALELLPKPSGRNSGQCEGAVMEEEAIGELGSHTCGSEAREHVAVTAQAVLVEPGSRQQNEADSPRNSHEQLGIRETHRAWACVVCRAPCVLGDVSMMRASTNTMLLVLAAHHIHHFASSLRTERKKYHWPHLRDREMVTQLIGRGQDLLPRAVYLKPHTLFTPSMDS